MVKLLVKKIKAGKLTLEEVQERYPHWYEAVKAALEG